MQKQTAALAGFVGCLMLVMSASGCRQSIQNTVVVGTPTEPEPLVTLSRTPEDTVPQIATAEPSALPSPTKDPTERQIINVPDDFVSPYQFILVEKKDAVGDVYIGTNRRVNLNADWRVKVIAQSADGLFLQVVFVEVEPGVDAQPYAMQTGWIYSYWAGFPEPVLPAQYTVVQEPTELDEHRQPYLNYMLSLIGATMVAEGTERTDDYVLPALNATQTQWAVLQTPQP